jgi:enoyl-CoA hydratase/carnithine racemase
MKIVILEGEGPVFCSGHNLKELSDSPNPRTIFDFCAKLMMRVKEFPLPTLCRINGIAAAAGFQLALSCDMIIATEKSTFLTPGIKWGLFCSTPAVELIRSINSRKKAMEMLFFG